MFLLSSFETLFLTIEEIVNLTKSRLWCFCELTRFVANWNTWLYSLINFRFFVIWSHLSWKKYFSNQRNVDNIKNSAKNSKNNLKFKWRIDMTKLSNSMLRYNKRYLIWITYNDFEAFLLCISLSLNTSIKQKRCAF